jgi:hypothetical protein
MPRHSHQAAFLALALLISIPAYGQPEVNQLSAELDMKDFHDTATLSGPLHEGTPVTLTFKNNVTVVVTPVELQDDLIRMKAELLRGSGTVIYNSVFVTRYNSDAEISEKQPNGDLYYRLKLNPHLALPQ